MSVRLSESWPADRRLVLGIGSGRTGSESLGFLLNVQPEGSCSHEFSLFCMQGHRASRYRPPLAWDASREEVQRVLLGLACYERPIVGDVGSYWLPHLDWILRELPTALVVGITRSREAVVRSFLEKSGRRNHWMQPGSGDWEPDPIWDPAFPKYTSCDKREAIGLYWDEYYAECDRLVRTYPDRVRMWPLAKLSEQEVARDIVMFAGYNPNELNLKVLKPRNKKKSVLRKLASRFLRGS